MAKRVLIGVFIAALGSLGRAAWAQPAAPATDDWDARLTSHKGDVAIYPSGEEKRLPVENGMPVTEGDRVVTGPDGIAELCLDGGSLLRLSGNANFTLAGAKRSRTVLKLGAGTLLAKVQKLLADQRMSVETPTAVASVRGTELGVAVDETSKEDSFVAIFSEGQAEVQGQSGASESIGPGQETKVSKGQPPIPAHPLDRMAARSADMRRTVSRLVTVHKGWRPLSPAARAESRQKALARLRQASAKPRDEKGLRDSERRRESRERRSERRREKRNDLRERMHGGTR